MSSTSLSDNSSRTSPLQRSFALLMALALALSAWWLSSEQQARDGWLLLIGGIIGVALYQASFGFTTAWRKLIVERRGKGLRAQMVMLALAVCLFFPVLSAGELFGESVFALVRPLGWSVIGGAFIFGVGMQLGNGCASGNLYHAGGGQLRAIPSMIGFAAGGLWATADYEWWQNLPQLAPVSLIRDFGAAPAIALNLMLFAAIALLTIWLEKRRYGDWERDTEGSDMPLARRLMRGPWPLIWAGIVLALMNFATLAMVGRPWTVALAYPLWGAKVAMLLELDLEIDFWSYWTQPGREDALYAPLLEDATTLMNIGIIAGALLAANLAGRFSFEWRLPLLHWLAAAIGGVMLGYGATIAFGCNIGAFFGGIVSGSLHGWLWLVAAFFGSLLGTRLRPLFRLQ